MSNLKRHTSGHWYLTLKDKDSQLQTVLYRGVNLRLQVRPPGRQEVIARGRLTVYQPRGEYQLQVEELQPKGVGPLELAFRQLKEKLSRLGYFDRRKKPLPPYPRRVALVTSPTGAAVRDMLETLDAALAARRGLGPPRHGAGRRRRRIDRRRHPHAQHAAAASR